MWRKWGDMLNQSSSDKGSYKLLLFNFDASVFDFDVSADPSNRNR